MSSKHGRVLVVDDERFFREAISDVLALHGYECVTCEDGETALERADDAGIGVVVLDIRLPGIDGIGVLRELRKRRPDLRVIMLSAATEQDLVLEALRLGACDYLAKPLHDEELALAVKRAEETFSVGAGWSRLRERLERLVESVQKLSQRVWESDSDSRFAELTEGIAETASEVFDAGKSSIMLLDESGAELEVVAAVGRSLESDEMDSVVLGQGVAGRVFEEGKALVVGDVAQDDRFEAAAEPGRYETGSFALAPLETGERSFGVICVTDRASGEGFGGEDLSILRLFAMQVSEVLSSVLDPGSQEDRVDVDAADAEDRADAELARLVCDAVVSEVEPGRIIEAVLKPLGEALDAAPVSIFLVGSASGELVLEGEYDGGTRAERQKLESNRGLTGQVLQSGNLVASNDPSADPRFDLETDTPEGGESAPLLCIPLRLRGKVFGIFRAFSLGDEAPSARTGEVLAAALSAAIRNVLLYRSLVDSIAEVAEVRREATSARR